MDFIASTVIVTGSYLHSSSLGLSVECAGQTDCKQGIGLVITELLIPK